MLIGLAFFGVIVGISSGFFGIGGGTLLVPSLIYLGYDIKIAFHNNDRVGLANCS